MWTELFGPLLTSLLLPVAGLINTFRVFGSLSVEWPGKDGKHPRCPPKGNMPKGNSDTVGLRFFPMLCYSTDAGLVQLHVVTGWFTAPLGKPPALTGVCTSSTEHRHLCPGIPTPS